MLYESISPSELNSRIVDREEINLIDVRETMEFEIARIDGAKLLPLSQFNEWIGSLEPEKEIVVMCHHGIRSANLCMFLIRNGFTKVINLEGGIDNWSQTVDERIARY